MLTDEMDGARLRAFLAELFPETNLHAQLEVLEAPVQQTVAVEKDLAAVRRGDSPRAVLEVDPRDPPMWRRLVGFHVAAADSLAVLELAPHGLERVAQRDVHIFVRMMCAWRAVGDDLTSGKPQIDAHRV